MPFYQLVAIGGTDVKAVTLLTGLADLSVHLDVNLSIHIKLIDGQLVLHAEAHIAPLARIRSENTCQAETRPLIAARNKSQALFLGWPSERKSLSATSQISSG